MKISVCIIVKNEEKVIKRCLECVEKFADEIVVVDTGSTDKTKEIARGFTDKIYDFVWCCDFSKARNFSFSKATCDYVMWLDADDIITDENIEKLNKINEEDSSDKNSNAIRDLMKEWNSIGHVPFKEKDKIYKQYRSIVDNLFKKQNLSASKKKLSNFKSTINKETNLYREREKLVRAYENMKNEIKTYENNIGFLTSSSKKGNNLVSEMNRKIEKLKADLELITQKIAIIDESIKE